MPRSSAEARPAFWSEFVSRTLEGRDYVLDALRGLAIVGMILVNGAPPTASIYAPLVHSPWHGWTPADTIFPLFLFIVGVSITFALKRPASDDGAPAKKLHWKIVRRALLLFAMSIALMNFPYYELHRLKLTGVLTHIAVCYLIVALIYLHTTWRLQLAVIPAVWLVHWTLLSSLEVPGFGAGVLTPEGNAASYLDRLLLGRHSDALEYGVDLEGVLVMFSSVATTMIGVLTGHWLQSKRDLLTKICAMFAAGFALLVLGSVLDWVLPINKPLWTPSYVIFMAGISLQMFAAGYWVIEICSFRSWAKPLQVAGVNALALYILAGVIQRILVYGHISVDGSPVRLRYFVYEHLVSPWISGRPGALLYASTYLLVCFAFMVLLYRKRVFIKL